MKIAAAVLGMAVLFSSCVASQRASYHQQEIEEWDKSAVYDPVTGRSYHAQDPRESQMEAPLFDRFED